MMSKMVFKKNKDLTYRIINSEAVILTHKDAYLHTVNEIGSFIWECLNGTNTVEDVVAKVCEAFDVDEKTAVRDVTHFIEDLVKRRLLSAKKRSDS